MQPRFPSGLPFIIGNEAAERFSYYGMKAILVVFMTTALLGPDGRHAPMAEAEAVAWYHTFGMANYLFPIAGALLADIVLGKYRTIIALSLVYCLGHLALAVDATRMGLAVGLVLIAMGAGGIKPCVSAHLGDQFDEGNARLVPRAFALFYLAINIGGFSSALLTPYLLARYGAHVAFAVPGVFMLLATILFWLGRRRFVAIPPAGWASFRAELLGTAGRGALVRLGVLFLLVAVFWALYDQTGSSWVLQAQRMERRIEFGGLFAGASFEVLPSQIQALNPLLILLLVPIFGGRSKRPAVQRIVIGMVLAALAYAIVAAAEYRLESGQQVSVLWQCLAYVPLTIGEIFVSITTLEYAYTQAPARLKSFMTSFYLLSISLGNGVTAVMNFLLGKDDGSRAVEGSSYFFIFVGLALVGALLVHLCCSRFTERLILQERST